MQDLNDKVTGGTLSAAEWNEVPSEIQNVIEALGQVLATGDLNQLGKSIAGYAGAGHWYAEAGLADAYVVNPIGGKQGPVSLDVDHDGLLVRFVPGNANTGASTINVNALGDKDLTREDGSPLQSGDLVLGRDAWVRWDFAADDFKLQTFNIPGSLDVPRGYIDGFRTSNAADTDHDITTGIGIARDSTNADTIQLSSALTKQIDIGGGWVQGTNQSGFPSLLTLSINTWYHLFVIKNTSSGDVDAGFDTSLTAANLLTDATGFTLFRRVGAVLTDGSSNIIQYQQFGDEFHWNDSRADVSTTNPGTGEVVHTLNSVPTGLSVLADVAVTFGRPDTSANTRYKVGPGSKTISAPSTASYDARTQGDSRYDSASLQVLTDAVQTIKTRQDGSNANATLQIQTHGWVDPRGKDA